MEKQRRKLVFFSEQYGKRRTRLWDGRGASEFRKINKKVIRKVIVFKPYSTEYSLNKVWSQIVCQDPYTNNLRWEAIKRKKV